MMEKETLEQKTLMELRTMAKEMGLGPISALKKGDLIARIKEKQSQSLAKNVEDVTVCGFSEETAQMPKEEMAQPENHERPLRETPDFGSYGRRFWLFENGKLPAGNRGYLCFSFPDPPFSAENRGCHQRHFASGKRRGEIRRPDFC